MLPMSVVWQEQDLLATSCQINRPRTASNNQSSASQKQYYPSQLPGIHLLINVWERDTVPFPNINEEFYSLTFAIFLRAIESTGRRPDDVKYFIMYLRYLRGLPHDVRDLLSLPVTKSLVLTLALQVGSKLGDTDQDIEEMTGLCDELLNSDPSTDPLTDRIMAFARTVQARVTETWGVRIPSEKVIGCLRRAAMRRPNLHFVSIVLAKSLPNRVFLTVSKDDYKEGMAILDELSWPWRYAESRTEMGFVVRCPLFLYSISEIWEAGVFRAGNQPHSYLP
jgi:hypothetical protein